MEDAAQVEERALTNAAAAVSQENKENAGPDASRASRGGRRATLLPLNGAPAQTPSKFDQVKARCVPPQVTERARGPRGDSQRLPLPCRSLLPDSLRHLAP